VNERPAAGPVTVVTKIMSGSPEGNVSAFLLRAWPLAFVLPLVYVALHGKLMDYADPVIGFDAVLCMVACLAVTPVITLAKMPIAKLRWWYGNWVFFLGAAGLELHIVYPPVNAACGMAGNSVNWTGTLIIALLLPMTATSSTAAQRLLGPEWKRWQRWLVWAVWGAIGVHLAVMHVWLILGAYLIATAPAIILRRPAVRKGIKDWRAGGYSTAWWWVAMAVLGSVALTGVIILLTEEVNAVASAVLGA
jgi:hypothetical protein